MAYKWLHRFDKDRLEELKDKKRTGRPPNRCTQRCNGKDKTRISR